MRRGLVDSSDKLTIKRECGHQAQLLSWIDLDDLVRIVAEAYQTSKDALPTRHSRGSEERQVLLYLAAKHCRGCYSLTEIGHRLGPISLGALSGAKSRMGKRLTDDKRFSRKVKEIEKRSR